MSDAPVIAQKGPFPVGVEAGRSYLWCACGRSKTQPFCDGSHKATSITPVRFQATDSKKIWLCGCKNSGNKPYCDGTHKGL